MIQKTKQKRLLKREVFEELSSWDLSSSETLDSVNEIIGKCGKEISLILSEYFLSWESLKFQRDDVIRNLENNYTELSKKEMKKQVVELIKEYWNSEEFKEILCFNLSSSVEIDDLDV
jgi:hypothetical protein